jgi:hypothetical protein
MSIKWGIIYQTTDNKSANTLKEKIEEQSKILGSNSQVIPGVHIFPRENDKTMCNLFVTIQKISDSPALRGKVKLLRLIRLTDDSCMLPALNPAAVAIKPPTNFPSSDYGSMH